MDLCGQYSSHVKATNVLIHTYIPAFQTPSKIHTIIHILEYSQSCQKIADPSQSQVMNYGILGHEDFLSIKSKF